MDKRPTDDHINVQASEESIDKVEDRRISRGFWRYVLVGYAIGLFIGAIIFVILLMTMSKMELGIPWIFVIAALAQIGTGGGLVGAGIYVSKMIDRDDDDEPPSPGGGRREAASPKLARSPRRPKAALKPSASGA